jgi:hypothetical protein
MVQGKQGLKEDPEVRCQVKTKDNPRVNQQADQEAKDQMVQGKQGLKEDPEVKCQVKTKDNPRVNQQADQEVKDQMVQDSQGQDTREALVKVKAIKIIKEHQVRTDMVQIRGRVRVKDQMVQGSQGHRVIIGVKVNINHLLIDHKEQLDQIIRDVSKDSLVAHNNKMVGGRDQDIRGAFVKVKAIKIIKEHQVRTGMVQIRGRDRVRVKDQLVIDQEDIILLDLLAIKE